VTGVAGKPQRAYTGRKRIDGVELTDRGVNADDGSY
jgi:hypothetical protein